MSRLLAVPLVLACALLALPGCGKETVPVVEIVDVNCPEPSETGPHPQVAFDGPEGNIFQFGAMKVGDVRKHTFTIYNKGKAPLKIFMRSTSCKCTLAELGSEEIPPGGKTSVALEWKAERLIQSYRHGADLCSNDPAKKSFRLEVHGSVQEMVAVVPGLTWNAGTFGDQTGTAAGSICSAILDEFEILKITSSSPHVSAKYSPLSKDELKKLERYTPKSGFRIVASLDSNLPVGRVHENLTIKVKVAGETREFRVEVFGTRSGPVTVLLPPNQGGVSFDPRSLALDLRRFSHDEGRGGELLLIVTKPDGKDIAIGEVVATPKNLKVQVVPDDSPEAKQSPQARFVVRVTVPPGPKATYLGRKAATVRIKTSHPRAQTIDLRVEYVAG